MPDEFGRFPAPRCGDPTYHAAHSYIGFLGGRTWCEGVPADPAALNEIMTGPGPLMDAPRTSDHYVPPEFGGPELGDRPPAEAPAAETVTGRERWCENAAPHEAHEWPPGVDGNHWCWGISQAPAADPDEYGYWPDTPEEYDRLMEGRDPAQEIRDLQAPAADPEALTPERLAEIRNMAVDSLAGDAPYNPDVWALETARRDLLGEVDRLRRIAAVNHGLYKSAEADVAAATPPGRSADYRLVLRFGAASDTQAARFGMAWAETCATEFGTRDAVVQRADGTVLAGEITTGDASVIGRSADEIRAVRTVGCPRCQLGGGQECITDAGVPLGGVHLERMEYLRQYDEATSASPSTDEIRAAIMQVLARDDVHEATADAVMEIVGPLIAERDRYRDTQTTVISDVVQARDEQRQRAERAEQQLIDCGADRDEQQRRARRAASMYAQAERSIAHIRNLHRRHRCESPGECGCEDDRRESETGEVCGHCTRPWPCPTRSTADQAAETGEATR